MDWIKNYVKKIVEDIVKESLSDEPVGQKDEPVAQKDEPTRHKDEPTRQKDEPTGQKDEPTDKKDEPTGQTPDYNKQIAESLAELVKMRRPTGTEKSLEDEFMDFLGLKEDNSNG